MKARITALEESIKSVTEDNANLEKFICTLKYYINLEELTPEILHSFVDRIEVGEKVRNGKSKTQAIKIIYNFRYTQVNRMARRAVGILLAKSVPTNSLQGKEFSQNPKIFEKLTWETIGIPDFPLWTKIKNRIGFPDCCSLKIWQNLILAIFLPACKNYR